MFGKNLPDDSVVGSPLKKQRGSIYDHDDPEGMKRLLNNVGAAPMGNVLAQAEAGNAAQASPAIIKAELKEEVMEEEEL
jgi:hypothetical protein